MWVCLLPVPWCCSTARYSVLFEVPSLVFSFDLGCLNLMSRVMANNTERRLPSLPLLKSCEAAVQTTLYIVSLCFDYSQKRSQRRKQHRPSPWWESFTRLQRSGTLWTRLPASWPGTPRCRRDSRALPLQQLQKLKQVTIP